MARVGLRSALDREGEVWLGPERRRLQQGRAQSSARVNLRQAGQSRSREPSGAFWLKAKGLTKQEEAPRAARGRPPSPSGALTSRASLRFWVRAPRLSHWSQIFWHRALTLGES